MGIKRSKAIIWYCGKSWEPWSPKSLEGGIAGSQSAVIYLSREWAAAGHKVTVYNYCAGQEGIYDNVEYINFDKFDGSCEPDVLIVWREKNLGILDGIAKAKKIMLELHDVPYRTSLFSKERLQKIDRIVFKSKFHRSQFVKRIFFSDLDKRKFIILPNGIDTRSITLDNRKFPLRMIYASNYTRGLEYMLKYGWPIIKKEIPQAELHVYYGWGYFDAFKKDPASAEWKSEMVSLMNQAGVIDHGRVGLNTLMEEKSKSSIHYYGCTWPETDCISVRESALAGCVPVTTRYASLAEKPYCITVGKDPLSRKTQESLAHKIVQLLSNPKKLERISAKFRKLAAREGWNDIAKRWMKEF